MIEGDSFIQVCVLKTETTYYVDRIDNQISVFKLIIVYLFTHFRPKLRLRHVYCFCCVMLVRRPVLKTKFVKFLVNGDNPIINVCN